MFALSTATTKQFKQEEIHFFFPMVIELLYVMAAYSTATSADCLKAKKYVAETKRYRQIYSLLFDFTFYEYSKPVVKMK